jgi:hypothetical protein
VQHHILVWEDICCENTAGEMQIVMGAVVVCCGVYTCMVGDEPGDCRTSFMVVDEAVASRALHEALWAPHCV